MARWRIGTVLRRYRVFACTMIVTATIAVLAGAQRPKQDPRPQKPDPGRSPAVLMRHGIYPAEEWFVRDLYARLARYEAAGRQFHAVRTGERPRPAEGLQVRLSAIESGVGRPPLDLEEPTDEILTLTRELLCQGDDPCHVLYDVSWGTAAGQQMPMPTVPDRYTQYRVSLRHNGQVRSYLAYVLFYDQPDGSTHPQVFDPYIPSLDEFAGERSPFARAPWLRYVKTRRYAAIVKEAAEWRPELARWPKQPPAGYVLGDRVTASDEMMVVMNFEPCGGQGITLAIVTPELRPADTGGTSSTVVRVHGTPGTAVSLQINGTPNSGGHVDGQHIGARHVGALAATNGVIGGNGVFATVYTASHIAGPVTIVAQGGGGSDSAEVRVRVQGLEELLGGTGYALVGFTCCPWHPQGTNHWGTPTANTALTNIPLHYRARFSGAATLQYNDQSLPLGGKFDLDRNWQNGGSHAEHRVGINTDVRQSDVPQAHRADLEDIFAICGSPNFGNEASLNHWHLRQTGAACAAPVSNNAQFVSQSVPTSMTAGQSYTVSVTMRNTGTFTWTAVDGYKLGSQNPQDNGTWGTTRAVVPATVAPGNDVTFSFTVTAPSSAGAYNFQWRMVQEWIQWFGEFTPNVVVSVGGGGGGPGPGGMQPDSAIRGCSNWSWWNPVWQPNAGACYNYCAQNNANACEWFVNGDCYVEFGSGCYVQPGFAGWSAAVLSGPPAPVQASVRPKPNLPSATGTAERRGLSKQP